MTRQALQAALREALAARRISLISDLLALHGQPAFADAVARCSPRVAADLLTLLDAAERDAVLRRLPRGLRAELRALGVEVMPRAPRAMGLGLLAWAR
ncbi:hypothetical protein GCM10027082_12660 [Comamonas humi]